MARAAPRGQNTIFIRDATPVVAREVVPADPVPVLAAASAGADMLVVARTAGPAAGAGRGPSAPGCARVAPCPVLVAPAPLAVPRRPEVVARARRL